MKKVFITIRLLILLVLIGFGIHNFLAEINYPLFNEHDNSLYIKIAHSLSMGKTLFNDCYSLFGPLFFSLPVITFKLFGTNYFTFKLAFDLFYFIISITILFFIFSYYFKTNIFLILLFTTFILHNLLTDPVGSTRMIRTALPLLSFFFFIRGLDERNKMYFFLSGALTTISFLFSYEMGIMAFVSLILIIIFSLFSNFKMYLQNMKYILIGVFSVVTIATIYMLYLGIFGNYIQHLTYLGISKWFGMRDVFVPRLNISFNNLHDFFESIYNILFTRSEHFKIYLLIFTYIFAIMILLKFWKEAKLRNILLIHIVFGIFMFRKIQLQAFAITSIWSITGPFLLWLCLEHLYLKVCERKEFLLPYRFKKYGLILFTLLCIVWIFRTQIDISLLKEIRKGTLYSPFDIAKIFSLPIDSNKVFYDRTYSMLDFDLAADTAMLLDYIEKNTKWGETIINFPWGFYSALSLRNYAMKSIYEGYNLKEEIEQLETIKPRYAILNMYDNLGIIGPGYPRGDVYYSLGWSDNENSPGICSDGRDDLLIKYLIENYSIDKVFKYSIVLKRREIRFPYRENLISVFMQEDLGNTKDNIEIFNMERIEGNRYKITGDYAYLSIKLPKEYKSYLYETRVKVHYSFPAKYFANGKLQTIINPFENTPDVTSVDSIDIPLAYEKNEEFLKIKRGWATREVKVKNIKIAFLFNALFNIKPDFVEIDYVKLYDKIPTIIGDEIKEDFNNEKLFKQNWEFSGKSKEYITDFSFQNNGNSIHLINTKEIKTNVITKGSDYSLMVTCYPKENEKIAKSGISLGLYNQNNDLVSVMYYIMSGKENYWGYNDQMVNGISYLVYVIDTKMNQWNTIKRESIFQDYNFKMHQLGAEGTKKNEINRIAAQLFSWTPDGKIDIYYDNLEILKVSE